MTQHHFPVSAVEPLLCVCGDYWPHRKKLGVSIGDVLLRQRPTLNNLWQRTVTDLVFAWEVARTGFERGSSDWCIALPTTQADYLGEQWNSD